MIVIFVFLIGLFIGSFLGVVIDRVPKKENFIKGRSTCDYCKKGLNVYDLIPVLSFIFLKGQCRYCHKNLSLFYPIVEISTGTIYVLTYLFVVLLLPFSFLSLGFYLIISSVLIVIFFIDLKFGIIPDKIILPVVLLTSGYLIITKLPTVYNYLFSAVAASLLFITITLLYYLLRKKIAMGGGDIKFSFLMGLILGFPGIIVGLYSAFLTAALYSIILIIWRKNYLKDSIPFGPFLVTGTFISIFWGNLLLEKGLILLGLL